MLNHLSSFGLIWIAIGLSCSSKTQKSHRNHPSWGPRAQAVIRAGQEMGMSPHILMVAAYTQSRFISSPKSAEAQAYSPLYHTKLSDGENTELNKLMAVPNPNPHIHSLWAQSHIVARRLQAAKQALSPQTPFHWLTLMADALMEEGKKSTLQTKSRDVLLGELIKTYNTGLRMVFPDHEVIALPPPREDERVDLKKLTLPDQQRFLNLRVQGDTDWDTATKGNPLAQGALRSGQEPPWVHIRWCSNSQANCFKELAQAEDKASHLLVIKSFHGPRVVQYHPLSKDLKWGDGLLENTVVVTLCGPLSSDGSAQEWLSWEDYGYLRKVIWDAWELTHLNTEGGFTPPSAGLAGGPEEAWAGISFEPTTNPNPEEGPRPFWAQPLPIDFDTALMHELLAQPPQTTNTQGGIFAPHPQEGEIFLGGRAWVNILPEQDAREIAIYKDLRNSQGDVVWELILKQEYVPTYGPIQSHFPLNPLPSAGSPMRRIKIVSRDENGVILSALHRRFLVGTTAP